MNHLVALKDLKKEEIIELLELAEKFIDHDGKILKDPIFPDKKIVNIFCEPSTRTKTSFEIAAKNVVIFYLLFKCPSKYFGLKDVHKLFNTMN